MDIDPKVVVNLVIQLMGGRQKAFAAFDKEHARVTAAWDRDTSTIGRILRAHLFVEHFLGEYLSKQNPRLGGLEDARLSFAQKLALVGRGDISVRDLLPGVRHLNAIRNRIAHKLTADVTEQDAMVFLGIALFRAMRDAANAPGGPSSKAVDVLEDFARHAGMMFKASASEHAKVWAEAIRRASSGKGRRRKKRPNKRLHPAVAARK